MVTLMLDIKGDHSFTFRVRGDNLLAWGYFVEKVNSLMSIESKVDVYTSTNGLSSNSLKLLEMMMHTLCGIK